VIYCSAKTNSLGCVPQIGWSGVPSASAGEGFYVTCSNVLNDRAGLLRVSTIGPNATPYKGGYNCVQGPAQRAAYQNSGGNYAPANDCTGGFVVDLNAYIASGSNPALVNGTTVWVQWWSRDSGFAPPNNMGLSAGLRFTIEP
jgi:hypothetical protein